MLEPGHYLARGVSAALGLSPNKGTEQVAVEFRILEPGHEGQRITWFGYFTDKTFDDTMKSLRACGWEGDSLDDLAGIDRNDVRLVLQAEFDDKGQKQVKVRWVNPAGGMALKAPMNAADAASFAQRMRAKVIAHRQANPAPPDKDIPFAWLLVLGASAFAAWGAMPWT